MLREIFVRISILWGDSYLALKNHEATASMQSSSLLAPPTGSKNCLQKNLAENGPTSSSPSSSSWSQADPTWVEWQKSCSEKSYGQTPVVFTVFKLRFPWQAIGCVRASTPCSRTRRGLSAIIQGQKLRNGLLTLLKQKYFLGGIFNDPIQKKKRLRLEVAAQKRYQHPIKNEFSISMCISGQLQVNKNLSSRALPWFLANNDIHVEKGVDLDLPWSPAM